MKRWQTPLLITLAGALVLVLTSGVRGSIGLFLVPMTEHFGWERAPFALAAAVNTLAMGALAPILGAVSDHYGTGRVIVFGAVLWVLGLVGMAYAGTPLQLILSLGIVGGIASGAASMSVAIGAVTRAVPEHARSRAAGIVTAGAAVGSVIMLPVAHGLIVRFDWQFALISLAALMALMLPAAIGLSGGENIAVRDHVGPSLAGALGEAMRNRGFWLLTFGFFICGVHTGFILVHLPAQLMDSGLSAAMGATALFLVGLANIASSYIWGHWGGTRRKKYLLSTLYMGRTVVLALFFLLPLTPVTVVLLSLALGFLFFGSVPLTSGLVGQMFGVRYLSMLFGFVFFGHQAGGFLGSWVGGVVYDSTNSYAIMWAINIALGIVTTLLHLPIDDSPLVRLQPRPAGAA